LCANNRKYVEDRAQARQYFTELFESNWTHKFPSEYKHEGGFTICEEIECEKVVEMEKVEAEPMVAEEKEVMSSMPENIEALFDFAWTHEFCKCGKIPNN